MAGNILISTAYLPPVDYFSLLICADQVFIEKEENYLKQSYRNRCVILTAHGPQPLSVPVYMGSQHKIPVKEIKIDYSKRWQQIHLRAMTAAYGISPYFEFYFDSIEKIISGRHTFLLDLNMELSERILEILGIETRPSFTTVFEKPSGKLYDYRYTITPKKESPIEVRKYSQVFDREGSFVPHLSIIDLIFNMGPEARNYL
jgi:hypothetical protein